MGEEMEVAAPPNLPIFHGDSWEEHVSAWIQIDEGVRDAKLLQGAVGSSLIRCHGKDSIGTFARDVKCERQRVYESIQVYRELQISGMPEIYPNLRWTHLVDALRCYDYAGALCLAADNDWTAFEFREKVRSGEVDKILAADNGLPTLIESDTCTVAELRSLIGQGRTFGTIYADPPWKYGNQATRSATDNHYPTMSVEEIAALPVKELAAEDCHLHLWTTNAFLFDCKQIMEAWGFEYKSTFVWVKPSMGIGNYWRVSHEFLLLGVRGSAPFLDHSQMSWARLDRTKHSEKPEAVRRMIELVSPAPRLELFGRRVAGGWTVWGNEIKRTMFDAGVPAHDANFQVQPAA